MSKEIENPAAFPCIASGEYLQEGMTLRDYFAAKALGGIMSNAEMLTMYTGQPRLLRNEAYIARDAYELADAMLKERSK